MDALGTIGNNAKPNTDGLLGTDTSKVLKALGVPDAAKKESPAPLLKGMKESINEFDT